MFVYYKKTGKPFNLILTISMGLWLMQRTKLWADNESELIP